MNPSMYPSNEISQDPGTFLRTLRIRSSLSQLQISALLHTSRQSYSAYERSERMIPDHIWNRLPQVIPLSSDELTQIQSILVDFSEEEKDLLSGFRRLDENRKKQILMILHDIVR